MGIQLSHLTVLPVGTPSSEQDIGVHIVPRLVVVAGSAQVDRVGAAVASHSQHQVSVHPPLVVGVSLEGSL